MRAGDVAEWIAKFPPDMPVFVLLAQDTMAPRIVQNWIAGAESLGVIYYKREEAGRCANQMEEWQRIHGSKVPD